MKLPPPPGLPPALEHRLRFVEERLADLDFTPRARISETAARVAVVSDFVLGVLVRHTAELLARLEDDARLDHDAVLATVDIAGSPEPDAMAVLRRRRNVELARLAWRDIAGWASFEECVRDLSTLADAMVDAAVQARNMHPDRFRHPVMDVRNAGVENRWNLPHNIDRWRPFYDLRNPEDYNTAGEPHRFFFQTDAFVDMLEDLNRMESLGLFNPIIWTSTESQEKLALLNRGEIFIEGEDDADNVGSRTRSLQEIYPDERYAFLPRFSADPAKYRNYPSGRVSVGWLGLTLPKNKENTLRAAAYVAYLMSEYFQKLQQFGEEGVHHDVVDGWPAMKPEIQAEYGADRTVAGLKYNFNLWHGAFRDDFWAMVKRQQEQQSMVEALNVIQPALENFQDTSVSAEAAPVNYETDSEELKIYSAIREVLGDGATRIVLQSDDVAGDYAALLARIEELGVGVLNDLHTQHMIDFDALIEKYNY